MYAGGLSYFSSGLEVCGFQVGACRNAVPLRAGAWPEAVASGSSELKQINRLTVETAGDLISGYIDCGV